MGIHSGEAAYRGEGYVGIDVHRAARIAAAAHGGQVLVSETTRNILGDGLRGVSFRDLGEHQLKDLDAPMRVFQVVGHGLEGEFPPLRSLNRLRHNLPTQPTTLVGREDEVARACALLHDGSGCSPSPDQAERARPD